MIFYIIFSHFCNIIGRKWSILVRIGSKWCLVLNWEYVPYTGIFFIIFAGVGNGLYFGQEISLHYDDWSPKVCKDNEFQIWFESL